jgi:hypothetical protein
MRGVVGESAGCTFFNFLPPSQPIQVTIKAEYVKHI